MIKHLFSTICNRTSIDRETNSLSIFNIIEEITIISEPDKTVRIPLYFEVVSQWTRSDENIPCIGTAKVFMRDPAGTSNKLAEIKIDLDKNIYARTIIRISGVELRGPGMYTFQIDLKTEKDEWSPITTVPFQVIYRPPSKEKTLKSSG